MLKCLKKSSKCLSVTLGLVLISAPAGCLAQVPSATWSDSATGPSGASLTPAFQCSFAEANLIRAVVNGAGVYVDPDASSSNQGAIVLSGSPNYVWSDSTPAQDSIFGVQIKTSGDVRIIAAPTTKPIGMRHWVANADSGWLVAFVEIGQHDVLAGAEPTALWTAIWDGRWREVSSLNWPQGYGRPGDSREGEGDLVRIGDEAWLVLKVAPRERALLFRLNGSRLTPESWFPIPRVRWLAATGNEMTDAIIAYIHASGPSGVQLRTARLVADTPLVQDLFAWAGSVTVSGFDAVMADRTLVVLVEEPRPTIYLRQTIGRDRMERVVLNGIPESSDNFLSVLPGGWPVVVSQPRRLSGGTASVTILSLAQPVGEVIYSAPSPFAALQSVIPMEEGIALAGTIFRDSTRQQFMTAVQFLPTACAATN